MSSGILGYVFGAFCAKSEFAPMAILLEITNGSKSKANIKWGYRILALKQILAHSRSNCSSFRWISTIPSTAKNHSMMSTSFEAEKYTKMYLFVPKDPGAAARIKVFEGVKLQTNASGVSHAHSFSSD